MRQKFGILLGDAKPIDLGNGIWRLYDDARAEIYGHPNEISEKDYQERMEAACEFLEGKAQEWLKELEEQMHVAASQRDYEKAAAFRDRIEALKRTAQRTRKFERNLLGQSDPKIALQELKEKLKLTKLPNQIECFDITSPEVSALLRWSFSKKVALIENNTGAIK